MSKINDLIKELCPNGVKKLKLQDIVKFENGKGHERVVNEYGKYILLTSKAISTNMKSYRRTDEQLSPLYKDDITMVMSDLPNGKALAKCFLVDQDNLYTLNQRICRLTLNGQNILPKYLYYLLNRNCQLLQYDNGVDQTNLRKNDILKVELLIPPLEVQEEIVRILDKFGELEVELEAELEARQSQYEFWRGKLLAVKDARVYKLNDLVDLYLGLTHTPKYVDSGIKFISSMNISKGYLDLDNTKFISQEEYNNCTSNAKPKKGDVLYVRVGSNLGHPVIYDLDEEICVFVSVGFARVKDSTILSNRYLKHWMDSDLFMKQVKAKTMNAPKANLNATWMKDFEIFVPNIDEQIRIISLLDKFDKLVNDITEGIPAEIKLRRKQYEYYRNKLLSFEELSVSE